MFDPNAGRSSRPAWARIDLDALSRNFERLRAATAPSTVLAVVKADAYGHGAGPVARRIAEQKVAGFGVAFASEAVALREAGVENQILVLGPTLSEEPGIYHDFRLTPTISGMDQLELWLGWTRAHSVSQEVHLKVDTGMNRLGVAMDELPGALQAIRQSSHLRLVGVLSHLSDGDEPESPANAEQTRRFLEALELLTSAERESVIVHLANSGGALYQEATRHSMVRIGLALYGVDPARRPTELEPVMELAARVVAVRNVPAGARVGYGGGWRAERATRLAVVPVGYGDGYPWRLSNRGSVLLGGKRRPIAGRVSMDMILVDVADDPVRTGDEAVLLGAQGEARIDAWELADLAGTVSWELLCLFGLRLPRRYASSPDQGRTG